ncbi:hypothetical protein HERIO_1672 [Hepatospora eriocheir]|uniref:Spc7 kinetochore protein domain-containing protein n=1 Tax=Hepatospora eriocheir TaxID=1081669 RepID=A0A1X0Q9M0_9MICR|nr:hypothetical protein HERIO_1672 [Hepatospora eriocheir]
MTDKEKREKRVSFNPEPKVSLVSTDKDIQTSKGHENTYRFDSRRDKLDLRSMFRIDKCVNKEITEDLKYSEYTTEEMKVEDIEIIENVNQTKEKAVNQFFEKHGIRFLDNQLDDFNRRESISKTKNNVDPECVYWYAFVKEAYINHFDNMTKYLLEQNSRLQCLINAEASTLNVDQLGDSINFKKLRNESRNQAKQNWYDYRIVQEENLGNRLEESKNKLLEIIEEKRTILEAKKEECELLENKNKFLSEKNIKLKESVIDENEEELQNKVEELRNRLYEHKSLLGLYKSDLSRIKNQAEEKRSKEEKIAKEIGFYKSEIEELKSIITIKKADKNTVEALKEEVKNYETYYGLKFIKISSDVLVFKYLDIQISCVLEGLFRVSSYKIDFFDSDDEVFNTYFKDNLLNKSLNRSPVVETPIQEDINGSIVEDHNIYRRSLKSALQKKQRKHSDNYINTEDLGHYINDVTSTPVPRRISVVPAKTPREKFIRNFKKLNFGDDASWVDQLNSLAENSTSKDAMVFENIYSKYKNESIPLRLLVNSILFKVSFLNNLKKEIELLRDSIKIDTIYTNQKIYLRFYLQSIDIKLPKVYAYIDENLNLFHDSNFVCNLLQKLNGLTNFLIKIVENK